MNKIICFINGIISSIKNLSIISGHDYVEVIKTPRMHFLCCLKCGHCSVSINKGGLNE